MIRFPKSVSPLQVATALLLVLAIVIGISPSSGKGGGAIAKGLLTGVNFRVYPSEVTQTEPVIARHPLNHNVLFIAANTFNQSTAFISEGVYASTDGGLTWSGSDTCNGAPIWAHGGDPGITIDTSGSFILTHLGGPFPGLYSHYSTDNGASWSAQNQIAGNDQTRASVTTDDTPASTDYGMTHATWVRFAPPFPVLYSKTSDGGASWDAASVINAPSQRCQGAVIATGPSGELYVCWAVVGSSSPFTEDALGFASSTNSGESWSVNENAIDINGISGTLPLKDDIRVNGFPQIDVDRNGGTRNGWVYIVTTQTDLSPAGSDPDIILYRSSDGGANWSAGIRVNQDAVNNGKTQYFPAIHVDTGGGVNILYYSDTPTTSDSAAIYLARSADGGTTWTEVEVGDHRFQPRSIGGFGPGYQGDNISLTSTGDTLWPVWMDNSSGLYQIWTGAVRISSIVPVDEGETAPPAYRLDPNYPNPFNPFTTISFTIARREFVTLEVFDISGKSVSTLLRREMSPGPHRVDFNAREGAFPSGLYFYRLSTPSFSAGGKMLLLK